MSVQKIKSFFVKNSPLISMGGAGVGYIGAAFLAVRATKKALRKVDEVRENLPVNVQLTKKDIVKLTWKYYIPTVSLGAGSTVLLCYAGASYEKRNRAALAACAISEQALKEFKEAIEEKLSSEQVQEVYDTVAEKKIERAVASHPEIANDSNPDGLYWCLEPIGNHPFRSTETMIMDNISRINMKATSDPFDGEILFEDYCDAIGVERPNLGGCMGWSKERGLIDVYFDVAKYNGIVYHVIRYYKPPHYLK